MLVGQTSLIFRLIKVSKLKELNLKADYQYQKARSIGKLLQTILAGVLLLLQVMINYSKKVTFSNPQVGQNQPETHHEEMFLMVILQVFAGLAQLI